MNCTNKLHIQNLIARLGYDKSPNFFLLEEMSQHDFSFHVIKILSDLKPYAAYFVDQKPFVLFFNIESTNNYEFQELNKKIWNAHIPLVFFCSANKIEIYNGTSLNLQDLMLDKIQNYDQCYDHVDQIAFSYWDVTAPLFWKNFSNKYSSKNVINELLLNNIEVLTKELKEKFKISFATKLILRLIFIRFLIDRGVALDYRGFSGETDSDQNQLLHVIQDRNKLYSLFAHLKEKFNGNLFDLVDENPSSLSDTALMYLSKFLAGTEQLNNGQYALFKMYDFNIIPVELISNIYEKMLGETLQKQDNAFYTPYYLVNYLSGLSIQPHLQSKGSFRVLDPACGSGIFLVECYRKLIEYSLSQGNKNESVYLDLLTENIFGVDLNEEAIDITIFSLYLTILDYKDPKTLLNFKLPYLKNINLFVSDFFDDDLLSPIKKLKFDFIVGNPPWGNVKGKHIKFCKDNHFALQRNDISTAFVYKIREYCSANTICSLILHSKVLYNKNENAKGFRKFLLTETHIKTIVELSSVRKIIFKHANAPAMILELSFNKENALANIFKYISLKPNIFFKLFNIIVIEKNDIKYIKQSLLNINDWAWKTIVYGSSWDVDIINTLLKKYKSIFDIIEEQKPSFITGTGIQINGNRNKADSSHLIGNPMLDSNNAVQHFHINKKTTIFDKKEALYPRIPELYEPPYCLLTKGVDTKTYKMKAAYVDEKYIFKETVFAIKANTEQKDILLTLVGLFNSSFYSYLNFMLGSSIGIEREQRFTDEILKFPFPIKNTHEINRLTLDIQNFYSSEEFLLNRDDKVIEVVNQLDQVILESFNLNHNNFVNYALNIMIPMISNSISEESIQKITSSDLSVYIAIFKDYFEKVYTPVNKYIQIIIYPNLLNKFTAFELFILDSKPSETILFTERQDEVKIFLSKNSIYQFNDLFYQIRDTLYFNDNSFFIIKTNEYKNWHPALAQIDLSEVIDRLLSSQGED